MDKIRFMQSCQKIAQTDRVKYGVGTLSEKTLHAVLKQYFENDETRHEIKVGPFVADIVSENGIIEIQMRNFNKLRKKPESFLYVTAVTVVYPVASTKWLLWIDEATGESRADGKAPKKELPMRCFSNCTKSNRF